MQKDQDEAKFLKERAARIDFDCYIQIDPETGEDTLFFVKPTDGRDGRRTRVYVFRVGQEPDQLQPAAHHCRAGRHRHRARLGSAQQADPSVTRQGRKTSLDQVAVG